MNSTEAFRRMRWLPLAVVLAVFTAGSSLAPAQQAQPAKPPAEPAKPPAEEETTPTFGTTVNVVLVPTTVLDKDGNTVNGLRPQDFTLFDNGKIQQITRDVAFLPLSFVICVQRTSNMDEILPKIQRVGNLLSSILVGQDGEAAIVSFDHRIEVLQDFTNDPDKIDAAIAKLRPGGRNNRVVDAVNQATFMLRHKKDRRKVILLISETLDRTSETRPREVATNLQVNNIEVYTTSAGC
jgi:VWFA-related protein